MLELGSSLPGYVTGENKSIDFVNNYFCQKRNRMNCICSFDCCSYYAVCAYGGIPKSKKAAPSLERF